MRSLYENLCYLDHIHEFCVLRVSGTEALRLWFVTNIFRQPSDNASSSNNNDEILFRELIDGVGDCASVLCNVHFAGYLATQMTTHGTEWPRLNTPRTTKNTAPKGFGMCVFWRPHKKKNTYLRRTTGYVIRSIQVHVHYTVKSARHPQLSWCCSATLGWNIINIFAFAIVGGLHYHAYLVQVTTFQPAPYRTRSHR